MQFKTITKRELPFFVALGLMAVLTSCGSFQYAGYDNDGIYSDGYDTEVEQPVVTTSTSNSNYYKNYFSENSAEVDAVKEESQIFTDIDSYEGNYIETAQDTLEQRPAYGGWGQNNNTVTINVIDNGWYGWNDPWFYGGYNSYGWAQPWGWNRWGYNYYGWGWGSWAYGGYSGLGWNNWGWNAWCGIPPGYNYWGLNNGYYGSNNSYAYNRGRRGVLYSDNLSRNTRSNSAISRRDYSTRRLSTSAVNVSRNIRSTRVSSNTSSSIRSIGNTTRTSRSSRTIRSTTPTRTSTRVTRPSRSTRSSGTVRSTRSNTRSSSGSVRSSSGNSRSSSGSVRSSSSSSRSSSGSRSSSSSSSRRGRG